MTKPNIALARFADTGSANVTDPPSGSRDTGFVAGDPADEGVMNALLLQAYRWFQYLDDGALEGNHSIDGDLEVTGDLTLDGVAATGLTAAANQHITVSGTGRFKHGTMVQNVPPASGSGGAWAWDATNGYLLSSGAGTWSIGIPTIVGWRVTDITFERYGDGSADLSGGVFRRPKTGTPTTIVSISVTNAAAAWIDESCSLGNIDIANGDSLWLALTANAPNLRIGEPRVTYAMI